MSSFSRRRKSETLCEDRVKDLLSSGERLRRSSGTLVASPKLERKARDDRVQYNTAMEALTRKVKIKGSPEQLKVKRRVRTISPIPDTPPSSQEGWTDDEEDQEEESSAE